MDEYSHTIIRLVKVYYHIYTNLLIAIEDTDHTISDSSMTMIWSRGQEHGEYEHFPRSGYELGLASDQTFYKRDELKYHGHRSQRGYIENVNFFGNIQQSNSLEIRQCWCLSYDIIASDTIVYCFVDKAPKTAPVSCRGEYSYPNGCEKSDCMYLLTWEYSEDSDTIAFNVTAVIEEGRWTGVGFAPNPRMENVDVVLADPSGAVSDR